MNKQVMSKPIEIDGISKIYTDDSGTNDVVALENIQFSVDQGEFVTVIGPSGCGKSTLLRLLSGLDSPTEGQIRLEDQTVEGPLSDVGFMFQSPVLFNWRTVFKNIMMSYETLRSSNNIENDPDHYKQRAKDLINLVGIDGFEDSYPNELSGGMQQRVALARTLLPDPSILLMDEPFSALDELTRHKMNKELLKIHKETNKTIVFVTHNIQEAVYLSDRVIVLSPRPGTIETVLDIELSRPRPLEIQDTEEFIEYVSTLREEIGLVES
jgi:NitT/TauT family transport system ATP-binding protein